MVDVFCLDFCLLLFRNMDEIDSYIATIDELVEDENKIVSQPFICNQAILLNASMWIFCIQLLCRKSFSLLG